MDICAVLLILHDLLLFYSSIVAMECGVNSDFVVRGNACPATCSDPEAPITCELPWQAGCACNDGFWLSGTECVRPEWCGCPLPSGSYYSVSFEGSRTFHY